jgi:hypothetical protein
METSLKRENNETKNRHTLPIDIGKIILYVSQAGFELEAAIVSSRTSEVTQVQSSLRRRQMR